MYFWIAESFFLNNKNNFEDGFSSSKNSYFPSQLSQSATADIPHFNFSHYTTLTTIYFSKHEISDGLI